LLKKREISKYVLFTACLMLSANIHLYELKNGPLRTITNSLSTRRGNYIYFLKHVLKVLVFFIIVASPKMTEILHKFPMFPLFEASIVKQGALG
jgi:hypothetical protein